MTDPEQSRSIVTELADLLGIKQEDRSLYYTDISLRVSALMQVIRGDEGKRQIQPPLEGFDDAKMISYLQGLLLQKHDDIVPGVAAMREYVLQSYRKQKKQEETPATPQTLPQSPPTESIPARPPQQPPPLPPHLRQPSPQPTATASIEQIAAPQEQARVAKVKEEPSVFKRAYGSIADAVSDFFSSRYMPSAGRRRLIPWYHRTDRLVATGVAAALALGIVGGLVEEGYQQEREKSDRIIEQLVEQSKQPESPKLPYDAPKKSEEETTAEQALKAANAVAKAVEEQARKTAEAIAKAEEAQKKADAKKQEEAQPPMPPPEKEKPRPPAVPLRTVAREGHCYSLRNGFSFSFDQDHEVDENHQPYIAGKPYVLERRMQKGKEVFYVRPQRQPLENEVEVWTNCRRLEEPFYAKGNQHLGTCYEFDGGLLGIVFSDADEVKVSGFRTDVYPYLVEDEGRGFIVRHKPVRNYTNPKSSPVCFQEFDSREIIRVISPTGVYPSNAPIPGRMYGGEGREETVGNE